MLTLASRPGEPLYVRYTKSYDLLLQTEFDVLTTHDGWLDAVLAEAAAGPADWVISGAAMRDACMYSAESGLCIPLVEKPAWVQRHLNGNALYRLTPDLQRIFKQSCEQHLTWPFDLASWLSARDLGMEARLHNNSRVTNVGAAVDAEMVSHAAHWGGAVSLVHADSSVRQLPLQAALMQMNRSRPVIITYISFSHAGFVPNFRQSVDAQGVTNILWAAFDLESYALLKPLVKHVVRNFTIGGTGENAGSDVFNSSSYITSVNKKTGLVRDIFSSGLSVIALDVDVFVQADFVPHILTLSPDRVYFSSESPSGYGSLFYGETTRRYFFNSGIFFMPSQLGSSGLRFLDNWIEATKEPGATQQRALNKMLVCTHLASCEHSSVHVGLLSPELFVNGAMFFEHFWPHAAFASRALVVHNNWADGFAVKKFRFQNRMLWPAKPLDRCTNATRLEGKFFMGGGGSEPLLSAYSSFFNFVRDRKFACAIIPSIAVPPLDGIASFDYFFSFATIAERLPGVHFVPAASWIESTSIESFTWDIRATEWWPFHRTLKNVAEWIVYRRKIPASTCVQDHDRTADEVALTLLSGRLPAVLAAARTSANQSNSVFLAGRWRLAHKQIERLEPSVFTSLTNNTFAPHELLSFGYVSQYGREGEDPRHDILDTVICSKAGKRVLLRYDVPLAPSAVSVAVSRFIPADVLREDMRLLSQMPPERRDTLLSRRILFTTEPLSTNGLSSRIQSSQAIVYLAGIFNMTVAMLPFQPVHSDIQVAPWSEIINVTRFAAAFPHVLPPSILTILMPRVIFDFFDTAQLALSNVSSNASLAAAREFPNAFAAILAHSRVGNTRTLCCLSPRALCCMKKRC